MRMLGEAIETNLEPIAFDQRKASALLDESNLSAMILSSPENVFYSSGLPYRQAEYNPILFTLSNQYPAFSVVFKDRDQVLIGWKGFDFSLTWVKDSHGILSRSEALKYVVESLIETAPSHNSVAIESTAPFYLYEELHRARFDVKTGAEQILSRLRSIKSSEEISRIRRSVEISEKAIERVLASIRPGVSEIELTRIAKMAIVEKGATGWDHITLSVGGSDPEYPGIGVPMWEGDIARIDLGTIFGGYTSDISRNASLGQPSQEVLKIYEALLDAQNELIDKIQPGVTKAFEVYELANQRLAKYGYQVRSHYVGHGIGIQTEEDPLLKPGFSDIIKDGMVLNIEIWVTHKPSRSLGIEDVFLVGPTRLQRLSSLERKLFVV